MRRAVLFLAAGLAYAPSARAHSGGASVALVTSPSGVGVLADQSFELTWTDADRRFETSTVTFDFFYTADVPPTAPVGVLPHAIEGRPIAVAVNEIDPQNRVLFDTSRVPAGSYVIWSIATEEPPDLPVTMVAFSRGVLTVAHAGDPTHPSVLVGIEGERSSSSGFMIPYEAFDPTGTASVSLWVTPRFDGSQSTRIAVGLPATARGEFWWSTDGFAPGRYGVRAEISDARGLSFSNYSRFHLRLDPNAPELDAAHEDTNPRDADPPDANWGLELGAYADRRPFEFPPGDADPATPDAADSCSCRGDPRSPSVGFWGLAVLWIGLCHLLPKPSSRAPHA